MNEMQVFQYENNKVRTVDRDGEVWWVLADVCQVLDVQNNRNVARRLDEDEKGVHQMDTLGGNQKMTIISESGLYKVILRSDKPDAKKFTRWVTHEVLPTIRRTGGYGQSSAQGFTLEQMTQFAAAVAAQVATQIVPIIAATVKQVYQEAQTTSHPKETIHHRSAPIPTVGFNNTMCKLESFPVEIVREVEGMLAEMQEQQNLNFSMIARFCTINGYAISSPAVKTYYQRHFSED